MTTQHDHDCFNDLEIEADSFEDLNHPLLGRSFYNILQGDDFFYTVVRVEGETIYTVNSRRGVEIASSLHDFEACVAGYVLKEIKS